MTPSFPNEILELIVEELDVAGKGPWKGLLKDLKSCCLVAKVFVPLCQKHIFHSVALLPGRTFMSGQVEVPSTTHRWADFMDKYRYKDHHPGIYVRKLKYYAALEDDCRNQLVVEALQMMPNVTELYLQFQNQQGGVRFDDCSTYWQTSLLSLIQQPNLKSLTIRNLRIPAESLLWSTSLEKIDIRDSWRCGPAKPRMDPVFRGRGTSARFDRREWRNGPERLCLYPSSLTIDSMSGADTGALPWRKKNGQEQIQSHGVIRLDHIHDLHFTVEGFYDYDIAKYVFENAQALRLLTLQMNIQTDEDTALPDFPDFPLKYLNTSSFASLTHLNLNIMNTRDWENTPLDDPYIGFCQVALTNFVALKELNLEIWIIDIVELPDTAFGPQWGFLDRALVADGLLVCRLLALDSVRIRVFLKIWDGSDLAGGHLADAEESLANIDALAYPRHFSGLLELASKGALKFSFETGVKSLPHNAPGHYHQTPQWRRHHT